MVPVELAGRDWYENEVKKRRREEGWDGERRKEGRRSERERERKSERGKSKRMAQKLGENERKRMELGGRNGAHEKR